MPSPSGALGPSGRIRPLEVRALMTTHRWLGRGADLEVLLLVAQTGSLQAAARAAGITVPSARHRLSRLYAARGIPRGGSQAARAHRCDNPRCVRPDHLFLGTDADNVHAAQVKGRSPVAA